MKNVKLIISISIIFLSLTSVSAQNFNDELRLSDPEVITSAHAVGMGDE